MTFTPPRGGPAPKGCNRHNAHTKINAGREQIVWHIIARWKIVWRVTGIGPGSINHLWVIDRDIDDIRCHRLDNDQITIESNNLLLRGAQIAGKPCLAAQPLHGIEGGCLLLRNRERQLRHPLAVR